MISNPYPTLYVGQKFENLDNDAFYQVTKAIVDAQHSYKVLTKNKSVWDVDCFGKKKYKCEFKIGVTGSEAGATLKVLRPHICPASVHEHFPARNSVKFLAHHHKDHIAADRAIRLKNTSFAIILGGGPWFFSLVYQRCRIS